MAQLGTVFRYVRADADKDISADLFELSLDNATWVSGGVVYMPPMSWTPSVTAANTANPLAAGFTGYWWRFLSGPGTSFPLSTGVTVLHGRATDSPEIPHFAWRILVTATE